MTRMKMNEVFNILENEGIFKYMVNNNLIDFISISDAEALDYDYIFNHSGEKYISNIVNVLKDTLTYTNLLARLSNILLAKYGSNWSNLAYALSLEYNPIENYDLTETETPDILKTETPNITKTSNNTTTNKTSGTNSNEDTTQKYGFNSANAVDTDKNIINGTSTANQNGTFTATDKETGTRTFSETGSRTIRKHGNIGVMSVPDQLEKEYELRRKSMFDIIYTDIDSILTLPLY